MLIIKCSKEKRKTQLKGLGMGRGGQANGRNSCRRLGELASNRRDVVLVVSRTRRVLSSRKRMSDDTYNRRGE